LFHLHPLIYTDCLHLYAFCYYLCPTSATNIEISNIRGTRYALILSDLAHICGQLASGQGHTLEILAHFVLGACAPRGTLLLHATPCLASVHPPCVNGPLGAELESSLVNVRSPAACFGGIIIIAPPNIMNPNMLLASVNVRNPRIQQGHRLLTQSRTNRSTVLQTTERWYTRSTGTTGIAAASRCHNAILHEGAKDPV
jgi:hypothetical protein